MRAVLLMWMASTTTSALAADITLVHQGRLVDAEGAPLNGTHDLTVTLYRDSAGAQLAYREVFEDVSVSQGYFALTLGADGDLQHTEVPSPGWVGTRVDTDDELALQPLATSPGAAVALRLSSADGTSAATPGVSCRSIQLAGGSTGSGSYWIDPDGPGGTAPYEALCDMSTAGGGWTLVHRKTSIGFNPIGSAFDPACAQAGSTDCGSLLHPALPAHEVMWRFAPDSNQVVVMSPPDHLEHALRGGTVRVSPATYGVRRWRSGVAEPPAVVQITVSNDDSDDGYISEVFSGTDQYLNLWSAYSENSPYNYTEVDNTSLRGRQCIAGYCRSETAYLFVR